MSWITFNPIRLQPLEDEILSSWIIRNSIANGSDPSSWAGAIWPKWRAWTRDLDRMLPEARLHDLSKSSGLDAAALRNMTLEPLIGKILNTSRLKNKEAWKWVIPTGSRNKTKINGLHFCPKCIARKPSYYKKSWRLSWVVACPIHELLLINKCPSCDQSVSPHLVTYLQTDITQCISCDFNLTQAKQLSVDSDAFWLQELMNRSIENTKKVTLPLGINQYVELFDAIQFLMVFFQNSLKNSQSYKLLHDYLGLNSLENYHTPSSGIRIEARMYLERHFLMIATGRLLKLTLSKIISLFTDIGITQQMFMISKTSSSTIIEINDSLPDNSKLKYASSVSKSTFKARSKKEVDALMAEILPLL